MTSSQRSTRLLTRSRWPRTALIAAGVILGSATASRALQVGEVIEKAWSNTDGADCTGTTLDPDNGGNRAVESLSKLEVLAQVGQHKAKLHLNTNTFYDPGAAQAAYLFPILFGRRASCEEIARYVGQDKWHTFREVACRPDVDSSWSQRLAPSCALPDSSVWDWENPRQPSRVYAFMLGEYLDGTGCPAWAGERSRERFTWNALKAKYGKRSSLIGDFTVFFDAITIDVGVSQERILDPGLVQANVAFWNNIVFFAVSRGWPSVEKMGRAGRLVLDIGWYEYSFSTGEIFALPGTAPKPYRQHLADMRTLSCVGNPDAKAGADPYDLAGKESADGALRNLFDKLAKQPQGTDIICSARGVCGNLFDFAKALAPDPSGKSIIRKWLVQLIRG